MNIVRILMKVVKIFQEWSQKALRIKKVVLESIQTFNDIIIALGCLCNF